MSFILVSVLIKKCGYGIFDQFVWLGGAKRSSRSSRKVV
uniref:Uncharacterized protein n=1 Tax=Anguilla anguilla TaxID=7936 RepID=A0A0E9UPK3_ANGAN